MVGLEYSVFQNVSSNLLVFRDPNGGSVPKAPGSELKNPPTDENEIPTLPYWDTYDTINQFYLEMGRYC